MGFQDVKSVSGDNVCMVNDWNYQIIRRPLPTAGERVREEIPSSGGRGPQARSVFQGAAV